MAMTLGLAGCFSSRAAPYEPARQIVRSIPSENAKAALRDLFEPPKRSDGFFAVPCSWTLDSRGNQSKVRVADLGEDSFSLESKNDGVVRRYRYADLAPHAVKVSHLDAVHFLVRLT